MLGSALPDDLLETRKAADSLLRAWYGAEPASQIRPACAAKELAPQTTGPVIDHIERSACEDMRPGSLLGSPPRWQPRGA